MGAAPDVQVEMNLYGWLDVSDQLAGEAGFTVHLGRSDAWSAPSTGTCSFRLRNDDGDWNPVNTSGAWGPYMLRNVAVRVTVNSVRVFTGYVDSYKPGVSGSAPFVDVECSDRFAALSQFKLGSYAMERFRVITHGTSARTYPLAAEDATTTSSLAAFRDPAATKATMVDDGGGGVAEFTNEAAGVSLAGSLKLTPFGTSTQGIIVAHPYTIDPGVGGSLWCVFRSASGADQRLIHSYRTSGGTGSIDAYLRNTDGKISVTVTADGGTTANVVTSLGDFNNDAWHLLNVTIGIDGKTVAVFVDGISRGSTTAGTVLTIGSSNRVLYFGGYRSGSTNIYGLNGYLAGVGSSATPIPSSDVTAMAAALNGDLLDTLTERADHLMEFFDPTSTVGITVVDDDGAPFLDQNTAGKSLLAMLAELTDSERGALFVDRSGDLTLRGVTDRIGYSTVGTITATADGDLAQDGLAWTLDQATFANRIEASGPAGSAVAETADVTSDPTRAVVESWTTPIYLLATATTDRLAARSDATPYLSKATIDLFSCESSIVADALAALPLDWLFVSDIPSQFGASSQYGLIEGIEMRVSPDEFTMTFDLARTG